MRTAIAALLLLGAAAPAAAETAAPPPGATACTGCHGAAATAIPPMGTDPDAIVAAMAAFRSGERPATVMNRIAKGFSDDEVRAIAAWLGARE